MFRMDAVSFKIISLMLLLLISALLLTEIVRNRPLCICKLSRLLISLTVFRIFL